MFGVCHQYLSSSVIEIALEGYFCSYESKEICVARNDVLEIYRLITSTNSSKRESSKSKLRHHNVTTHNKVRVNHNEAARLELVYSQRLHGNIESLAKASNPGNLDSIILAFGDYKVSVIHFEMSTYSFGTKSMHWFEDDEIKDGLVSRHSRPIVKVDSLSRCAAVLCYNRCLAILPLTRLDEMNNSSPTISNLRSFIVYPSYEVNGALHKINNIRDIEFLEAYFHPTLAILYEEEETWAGRLAVKEDTYSVIAIAVQSEDAKSLAFRVNNLPFDCLRLQAVPQPRGGVLVYTANALLYLNQNITPYGISLNSLAERSTRFPLEPLPSVVATLEESVSLFLNADVFLISLKSGDILLAVMTSDSGKSVPRFEMRRTISSVIPSCICSVGHNHIFLGSRVGDSLLISYESVVHELVALGAQNNKTDSEEKGQFCEAEEQEDELLVFETDDQDLFHRISYNFKVCDSIINIGPVVGLDVGEPEFLSEEFADPEKLALELVTCSGYGKNGCLCVLQEGVRPIVLMSHNYSAGTSLWAERLWAIYDPQKSSAQHDFLFLSKPDSTMLISTAESDFSEAEKTFFVTQESTIHVCNMLNGAVVVQVFKTGLLIYDGETCNTVRVGGGGIARSCNSETFLALALDNAHLLLFEINENTKMLNPLPSEEHSSPAVTSMALFTDNGNLGRAKDGELGVKRACFHQKEENDSDDEFLYGTADEELPDSKEFEGKNQQGDEPTPVKTYLFLVRLNGDLEIRLLPEGSLCFLVRGMAHGPRVLVGTGASDHEEASCFRRWKIDPNPPVITELLVVSFECLHGDIVLLAITHSGDLFVYRSYSFTETATEFDCLPLRFRRIEHEVTLRKMDNYEDEFASLKRHKEKEYAICELNGKPSAAESTVPIATAAVKLENTMTVFNNLGPYSGVVVTGPVSYWIMFSSSGLHFHPLYVEKGMKCITFFRNAGCPNGFIYFTGENAMRLAQLPSNVQFNARWPLRKVILRTTPHFLAYHPPSKTFVVAVSSEQPNKYKARAVNDTTEPLELAQEDARFVYPLEHRFEVLLLTPATWEIIDRFALEEFEHISALKVVSLNSEEVIEGKKSFIAVSTIVSQGEDVTCKGKVHLFDIVEVVPEPGRPHTTRKLKLVYSKEQRGPVTSLSAVSGHLLSAIGQKIFAWAFVNGELIGKAFIDSDIYIHRLESVKEFVLSADIRSGISLLRYQESQKTMSLVSRDYDLADACAVSFVVDDFTLAFMVADLDGNIYVLCFAPEDLASLGGTRLTKRADFRIGSCVNTFLRVASQSLPGETFSRVRHFNIFGTSSGEIGFFLPLDEKQFRRLAMLQSKMTTQLQHVAGLNPRAYRMVQPNFGSRVTQPSKNILDAGLLYRFISLPITERRVLAAQIGSTEASILQDLQEIKRSVAVF